MAAKNGAIALLAVDADASFLGQGFADVQLMDQSISVGAATIRGGTVVIKAVADSTKVLQPGDFGTNPASQFWGATVLGGILGAVNTLSAFVGVSVSRSYARVNVGTDPANPTVISADNLSVLSRAATANKVAPIGISFGAALGVTLTDSQANLGNVRVTAANDVTVSPAPTTPSTWSSSPTVRGPSLSRSTSPYRRRRPASATRRC